MTQLVCDFTLSSVFTFTDIPFDVKIETVMSDNVVNDLEKMDLNDKKA